MKRTHHQMSAKSNDSNRFSDDIKRMSQSPDDQRACSAKNDGSTNEECPQVVTYPYETTGISGVLKDKARRDVLAAQHIPEG